jgi:cathepsin D
MVRSTSALAFYLALVAWASTTVTLAAPTPSVPRSSTSQPQHLPVSRRSAAYKDLYGDDLIAWTQANTAHLRNKYASKLKSSSSKASAASTRKRDTPGSATLVNYENDSTYYSSVDVGTPSQSITLILDTGSSDIWAVQSRNSWDPSSSSTFENSTTAFSITYGSGDVTGTLAYDTMTLAGHTSSSQTFAIANSVSSGLLDQSVDGIMGFGFKSLSTSGATPFWQASGADQFAFYLASTTSATTSDLESYGGILTLGGYNTSLYQGEINWSNVVDETYWLITLGNITIDGSDIALSGTSKTAVDTGTTLIGAPSSVTAAIYAEIPGSSELASESGYYQYPCDTTVNATFHFGDQEYLLSGDDFSAGTVDTQGEYCMGAIFSVGSDQEDELQYILGDAFLTKVYTIFDNSAKTAQVGFASLADGLGSTTNSQTVSKVTASSGSLQNIQLNAWIMALFAIGAIVLVYA